MNDLKTVEGTNIIDPIRAKQKEDVARMRASLLSCSMDVSSAQQALKNVAVLRIYHQIARIISYTELMDKLEDKLHQSIAYMIEHADIERSATWVQLLRIQETLQKNMIESHKLLQPYLDIESYSIMDLVPATPPETTTIILDASAREKIRNSAQAVLAQLNVGDSNVSD